MSTDSTTTVAPAQEPPPLRSVHTTNFGLLLGEPGFLLFMRAQTLGQRTGHGVSLS